MHTRNCLPNGMDLYIARTCTEAGKDPGCCIWSSTHSCYVVSSRCYCDSYCATYNDCCEDVSTSLQCCEFILCVCSYTIQSHILLHGIYPHCTMYMYTYIALAQSSSGRVQSDLEQELKVQASALSPVYMYSQCMWSYYITLCIPDLTCAEVQREKS